jgi:replicative DNA helicase
MLGGGFYPGQLITLGAISSLGKTSFLLQAVNQIALSGRDVLLFSLEMGKEELIAKTLSWITANDKAGEDRDVTRSYREILNGCKLNGTQRVEFCAEELEAIQRAYSAYERKIAPHLYLYTAAETDKLCLTAEEIREECGRFIERTGHKPALIAVDYLQIVQPSDPMLDDKRATDEAVRTFKNIAVEKDVPLLVVSSFNRANYKTSADFESFKQSGLIEYSSDVVLAMQLKGTGRDSVEEVKARKAAVPRPVELLILKNRSAGLTEKPIEYQFDPKGNQFREEQGYFDNLRQDRGKVDENKARRQELRKEREVKELRELKAENQAAADAAAGKPVLYKPERELYPMIHTDVYPEKPDAQGSKTDSKPEDNIE